MRSNMLRRAVACLVVLQLVGCATSSSELIVPVNMVQLAPRSAATPRRAQVQLTDIRKDTQLERTTVGKVSMGQITLQPSVPELVQTLIETKADEVLARRGGTDPQVVLCGIRVFAVETPATLVYWDINTRIELVLRVRGQDRVVAGAATERTYLWPSDEIIGRVTSAALRQAGSEAEVALAELFAAPR